MKNALRAFEGIAKAVVLDNAKAVVKEADWRDPELNPKTTLFCKYYEGANRFVESIDTIAALKTWLIGPMQSGFVLNVCARLFGCGRLNESKNG
jgi:hypothetical protein